MAFPVAGFSLVVPAATARKSVGVSAGRATISAPGMFFVSTSIASLSPGSCVTKLSTTVEPIVSLTCALSLASTAQCDAVAVWLTEWKKEWSMCSWYGDSFPPFRMISMISWISAAFLGLSLPTETKRARKRFTSLSDDLSRRTFRPASMTARVRTDTRTPLTTSPTRTPTPTRTIRSTRSQLVSRAPSGSRRPTTPVEIS
jgi:hypothetical protein